MCINNTMKYLPVVFSKKCDLNIRNNKIKKIKPDIYFAP